MTSEFPISIFRDSKKSAILVESIMLHPRVNQMEHVRNVSPCTDLLYDHSDLDSSSQVQYQAVQRTTFMSLRRRHYVTYVNMHLPVSDSNWCCNFFLFMFISNCFSA